MTTNAYLLLTTGEIDDRIRAAQELPATPETLGIVRRLRAEAARREAEPCVRGTVGCSATHTDGGDCATY